MNEQDQVAPPVTKVRYNTDEQGRTFRTPPDGQSQHVSTLLEGDVVEYVSLETKKYAPGILSHLKAYLLPQGRQVKETRVAGQAPAADTEASPAPSPSEPAPAPVVVAKPAQEGIPPPPPLDRMLGDKTPAYVQWLRTYHPEEFRRRYGVMQGGQEVEFTTKEKQVGPNGRLVETSVRKRGLVAARKTCITHTLNT